jgi:hypothetical protein
MNDNLMCECGWVGLRDELVCNNETGESDDNLFVFCPDCGEKDNLESEDD